MFQNWSLSEIIEIEAQRKWNVKHYAFTTLVLNIDAVSDVFL